MFGLFGKRKLAPVLGLDISSTTVKLLELSHTGERYRVESYAVSSLPADAVVEKNINDVEGVANAIRNVINQSKTKHRTVAAAGSQALRSGMMPSIISHLWTTPVRSLLRRSAY